MFANDRAGHKLVIISKGNDQEEPGRDIRVPLV